MCSALGGRASEELNFDKISTGALNDLEKVTKQAYAMVSYFGMSDKVGNLSFYDSTGQGEYSFNKPYSEKTAEVIDEEVNRIIEEQYERAKKTLRDNMDGLTKLANQLLEKEVIFSEDLEEIFGPRKNGRTDLDGTPRSRRKSSTPRKKTEEAGPKLTKKEKEAKTQEEETPKSKTA